MLFHLVTLLLVALATCVQDQTCPSDSVLANELRASSSIEGVDWDAVVAEMRSGIDDGVEEGRRHIEDSAELPAAEREKADERFRRNLVSRFKPMFWSDTTDTSKIVYAVSALSSGIAVQLSFATSAGLGREFDSSGPPLLGSCLSSAYLFASQGLVLALASQLDRSALPLNLKNCPKPALLGGVFSALSVAAAVAGSPVVGFELSALLLLTTEIAGGLCIDKTGFFGYAAKRQVSTKQLMGGMVMASGFLTSLGHTLATEGGRKLISILPFFGLVAFSGLAFPTAACLNSALIPYAGSSLKAGAISLFVGMAALLIISFTIACADRHLPDLDFGETQWWTWVGGLLGSYNVWASTYLSKRLGLAGYLTLSDTGLAATSVVLDSFGIFVEKSPVTTIRALGVSLTILGMILVQVFGGGELEPARINNPSGTLQRSPHQENVEPIEMPSTGEAVEPSGDLGNTMEDLGTIEVPSTQEVVSPSLHPESGGIEVPSTQEDVGPSLHPESGAIEVPSTQGFASLSPHLENTVQELATIEIPSTLE